MNGLREERGESREHPVSNSVADPWQRPLDRVSSAWTILVERYLEVELEGHLRFRLRAGTGPTRDHCAVVRKTREIEGTQGVGIAGEVVHPILNGIDCGRHDMHQPVLVNVV